LADIHGAAGGEVGAVAAGAHAGFVAAGEDAAHLGLLDARADDGLGLIVGDGFVEGDDDLARHGIDDVLGGHAAQQAVFEAFDDLVADGDLLHGDATHLFAAGGEAVRL